MVEDANLLISAADYSDTLATENLTFSKSTFSRTWLSASVV